MRLYYAPGTIAVAIAICLEECGLDYDPVLVDFAAGAQTKPDYHAINPKGRVPALAVGDTILTETGAILEYLAAVAPQAGLMPADPLVAGHMRSIMYYLASTMHVNHAHKMRGHRWADNAESHADMTAKVPQTMTASAAYVEENAFFGDFIAGASISIGDAYLFVVCNWLKGDGVDVGAFPKIQAFLARMNDRASVQNVRAKGILR